MNDIGTVSDQIFYDPVVLEKIYERDDPTADSSSF